MFRTFDIHLGVLNYYQEAPYSSKSRREKRLKRVGGDMRKPWLWLWIKGVAWKFLGKKR